MKSKVTLLTAAVLCVILFALDLFIYFTLYDHIYNLEIATLTTNAQSIAQYYAGHNDEGQSSGPNNSSQYDWLSSYNRADQTVIILDENRTLLGSAGEAVNVSTFVHQYGSLAHGQATIVKTLPKAQLLIIQPVLSEDSNHVTAYVLLDGDISSVEEYMNTLVVLLTAGSIGAIVLAALGGYFISATAVRPIDSMIRLVQRIQVGHLDERVTVPKGRDEIARLASTFNSMLARIERSFAQQSRFVADASHEIRTPLTTIQGYANLLARWGKEDPTVLDKGLRVIQKEATRLRNLAEDLLTLASLEVTSTDSPQAADVETIVIEVVDSALLSRPQTNLETNLQGDVVAAIRPSHLKQILTNIVDNAIKYSPTPAEIHISASVYENRVRIEIRDKGRGIAKEHLANLFDRFYRVDESRDRRGGGTGLGLAIVKELVESYDGRISIESVLEQGTTIRVDLPLASKA